MSHCSLNSFVISVYPLQPCMSSLSQQKHCPLSLVSDHDKPLGVLATSKLVVSTEECLRQFT